MESDRFGRVKEILLAIADLGTPSAMIALPSIDGWLM